MKRVKKQDREERMMMEKQAMMSQQQLQSQEMAAQVAMQQLQLETQSKMQIKQAEVAFDIEKLKAEAELKRMLMAEEFKYQMQIAGIKETALADRDIMKEDSKSKRISQQNSEQSKLINQRKNNLPPLSFESNEDTLDGLDMAQFEPR
jgi:hypothetical protein